MVPVIATSSTMATRSSSFSASKNGCHRRKRPKCTSSQMRWKFPPGSVTSASCSARSMASTTQRRALSRKLPRRVEEKAVADKAEGGSVAASIMA